MEKSKIVIYDIMACNVYMDFENTGLQKEQHKFLIAFYPTPEIATPELIDKITAYGTNNYKIEFKNQEFTNLNINGWIYDRVPKNYWYMVNLPTGFLKEGEYTIEVKCKNGDVVKKSRFQKNKASGALVSTYLKNREKIYDSFSPSKSKTMQDGAPLKDVKVSWSTLKELGGLDAFYIYRLSEGRSGKEFNTQKLVWWDNIFVQRLTNPDAGLNRGQVVVGNELKPKTSYAYFVEITDSSAMGETNICIFQPHQVFVTP
ncbi:MAG: hypothetical protein NT082_01960 [Chloroflexi bacterium]|nr:hypothetical protein [Chloroflexota bacterium]